MLNMEKYIQDSLISSTIKKCIKIRDPSINSYPTILICIHYELGETEQRI